MHKALNNKAAKAVFLMVIIDVYPRIPFHLAVAFFVNIVHNDDIGLNPAGIYMFRVNNRNTRARCEMCSKLKIKTAEPCH